MSNTIELNGKTICVIPAGKYYLGDPQWVIRPHWDELMHPFVEANMDGEDFNGIVEIDDAPVVAFTAKHDRHTYAVQDGGHNMFFQVETGIIALVPAHLAENAKVASSECWSFNFEEPTVCTAYQGVLTFGPFVVDLSKTNYN